MAAPSRNVVRNATEYFGEGSGYIFEGASVSSVATVKGGMGVWEDPATALSPRSFA